MYIRARYPRQSRRLEVAGRSHDEALDPPGSDPRKQYQGTGRATARRTSTGALPQTGQLQVKVRDYTVSPRLYILVNTQISETQWGSLLEPDDSEVIELGIRYAAHLAAWATGSGLEVGFACNGRLVDEEGVVRLPAACSQAHLEMILQAMSKLEIIRERNFHTLMDYMYDDAISGMDIAVISHTGATRLRSAQISFAHLATQ